MICTEVHRGLVKGVLFETPPTRKTGSLLNLEPAARVKPVPQLPALSLSLSPQRALFSTRNPLLALFVECARERERERICLQIYDY